MAKRHQVCTPFHVNSNSYEEPIPKPGFDFYAGSFFDASSSGPDTKQQHGKFFVQIHGREGGKKYGGQESAQYGHLLVIFISVIY